MTFRRSIAAAALSLAVVAAVPCMAQTPTSTAQPSASATAGKQVLKIRQDMSKVQTEMVRIRLKVRNEMLAKPEWAQVAAAKKAAETNADGARRAALATLRTKEEYKKLVKEHDDAAAINNAANAPNSQVSEEDAKKAGDTMISSGFAMKKMENDVLKDDAKYTEATAQLDSVNAKMKELDGAVDLALKDDKEYQDADSKLAQFKTTLATAQQQLAQARKSDEAARLAASKSQSSNNGR